MNTVDRVQPHSFDAEEAVIGAVLKFPKTLEEVSLILPDESGFTTASLQKVYKACINLLDQNKGIDLITVADLLDETDEERLKSREQLERIVANITSPKQAVAHAEIVAKKAKLRQLIQSCSEAIEDSYEPDADPSVIVSDIEQCLTQIGSSAKSNIHHLSDLAPKFADGLLDGRIDGETSGIIKTRIGDLNTALGGGLRRGYLVVVGGSPSMGKSSFALDVVMFAGNFGRRSLVFGIDETVPDIVERMFQGSLGAERHQIVKCGPWNEREKEAITKSRDALAKMPMSLVSASGMTVYEIRSRARAHKRKMGQLDIIVVDYLQLIRTKRSNKQQTREREVAEISAVLKEIASELNCCVIAVSQLNRSLQSEAMPNPANRAARRIPRPRMSQLRDSGLIEADANIVLMPFLPAEYLRERLGEDHDWTRELRGSDPESIPAEIIVGKYKMGSKGTIKCRFHLRRMRFYAPYKGDLRLEVEDAPRPDEG